MTPNKADGKMSAEEKHQLLLQLRREDLTRFRKDCESAGANRINSLVKWPLRME